MERIVRQKNYQINQRSLALTGHVAIDDSAAVQSAQQRMNGSPHKMIIIPVRERDPSPSEHKKTQVIVSFFTSYSVTSPASSRVLRTRECRRRTTCPPSAPTSDDIDLQELSLSA
jgi:hypothetical protein